VAVKKLEDIFYNIDDAKCIAREVTYLRALQGHSNIVKLIDMRLPWGNNLANIKSG
jgi:hypothetical protein